MYLWGGGPSLSHESADRQMYYQMNYLSVSQPNNYIALAVHLQQYNLIKLQTSCSIIHLENSL